MSVTDNELELLETYLDGELSSAEVDALIDRLRREPALASAMETLKQERALRMAVWERCEPGDAMVGRLMGRVEKKVDDHWKWSRRLGQLRMLSGAAACVLVGVFVGRMGMNGNNNSHVTKPEMPMASNQPVVDVVKPAVKIPSVEVPVVDQYGRIVAWERIEQPGMAEPGPEQPLPTGNVVPVADEF